MTQPLKSILNIQVVIDLSNQFIVFVSFVSLQMDTWESRSKTWEGEDEDDSVKDSWDQDSEPEAEEKKTVPGQQSAAQPAGSKKSLKKICKRL